MRPSVHSASVVVTRGEEGAGFPQQLILLLQLAHPPTHCSDLSFHLAWIRTALTHSLAPFAFKCDPPTPPSPQSRATDAIVDPVSNAKDAIVDPVSNAKDATSR